jgi:energy-coupling factor transporter transmembrane protein EcfT
VVLLFGAAGAVSALSGVVPALGVVALSAGVGWASSVSWRRLVPVSGSFAVFLLLVPFAPSPAVGAIVKGLGVSLAIVVAVSTARWDRSLAVLQRLGIGRLPVAFLAIVLGHLEATGREAATAVEGLLLRGGFRGLRGVAASTSVLLARTLRSALERADRTADALALRGFDGRVPALPAFRPGFADAVPALAALLAVLLAAGVRLPWIR